MTRPYITRSLSFDKDQFMQDFAGIIAGDATRRDRIAAEVTFAITRQNPERLEKLFSFFEENKKALSVFSENEDVRVAALFMESVDGNPINFLPKQHPAFIQDVVNILGEERFNAIIMRLQTPQKSFQFNVLLGQLESLYTPPEERWNNFLTRRAAALQAGSALNASAAQPTAAKTPASSAIPNGQG